MTELSPEATRRLAERYLISNTPAYLFKHFRAEPAVQSLADNYTSQELVAEVVRIDRRESRTVSDVALAYAAAVALTYRDAREVLHSLNKVEIKNLEWIGEILAIWDASRVATSVSSIEVPYEPEVDGQADFSDASASQTTINLNGGAE